MTGLLIQGSTLTEQYFIIALTWKYLSFAGGLREWILIYLIFFSAIHAYILLKDENCTLYNMATYLVLAYLNDLSFLVSFSLSVASWTQNLINFQLLEKLLKFK